MINFNEYYNKLYDENIYIIQSITSKYKQKYSNTFKIGMYLMDLINNELKNPSNNINISKFYRKYLISLLIGLDYNKLDNVMIYTKNGNAYIRTRAMDSQIKTFYNLVFVYVWCKSFIKDGYSGIIQYSPLDDLYNICILDKI